MATAVRIAAAMESVFQGQGPCGHHIDVLLVVLKFVVRHEAPPNWLRPATTLRTHESNALKPRVRGAMPHLMPRTELHEMGTQT